MEITNIEKLTKLARIALYHGWMPNYRNKPEAMIDSLLISYNLSKPGYESLNESLLINEAECKITNDKNWESYQECSFNDLIFNHEPKQVTFIKALCIAKYKPNDIDELISYHQLFIYDYSNKYTSERISHFFEVFESLLNNQSN